ncbi:MAG: restriction endonuclease [bacterium]
MDIHQILLQIKTDFDRAITTARFNGNTYANGNKAKEALIRSQKIINLIHEFVKNDFVNCGVPPQMIFPPVGSSNPEIKIKGFLKSKNQDVTIIPTESQVVLSDTDSIDNEKILSVNIRSQLSSLAKNIDTLYERTFAEALNLHLSYPRQCLGEVYLIPTHEYDDKAMLRNQVVYKSVSKIENYIKMFQAINNRLDTDKDGYKYERVCLLIVDFRQENPKLYETIEDLKNDGLVPQDSTVTLENLTSNNLANDLLSAYRSRFGQDSIS